MPSIRESTFAAIDFESTGAGEETPDQPVQVGVAILEHWTPQWEKGFVSRIAVEVGDSKFLPGRGGSLDESADGSPRLLELWPELKRLLSNRWLLAHGAATERRFLRAFPFHGFGPWVDTLKLARALDPLQPSHTLGDLARAYGLESQLQAACPGFRWHDALCDAWGCIALFQHLIEKHGWESREVSDLLRLDDGEYHRRKARSR